MKRTLLILCALLAMAYSAGTQAQNVWDGTVAGSFAGGNGTAEDPYLIADGAQLKRFAAIVNGTDGMAQNTAAKGRLTADIELNDTEGWENWNESTEGLNTWTPIGNSSQPFTGTLDGDGHSVSGIYVNSNEHYQGFVGYLGVNGIIQNIGVKESYVKGVWSTGGVCGQNDGLMINCYNSGNVTGSYYVGGVCGRSTGTDNEYSFLTNCYNTGKVTGHESVGGVCGLNTSHGPISNCYNIGSVTGSFKFGSVCGHNDHTVTNCYYLEGTTDGIGIDFSGSGKVFAKSAEQFASGEVAYLLGEGWGQTIGTDEYPVLGGEKVYQYNDGTYGNTPLPMEGSFYLISTADELRLFASMVNGGQTSINGKLTADILLNDTTNWTSWNESTAPANTWTPIGNSSQPFTGTLDGDGHSVSGIYINSGTDYQGLVGILEKGGTLQDLGVKASYIKGGYSVGGLCGWKFGTVTNCYNTGSVEGNNHVGGLCGDNYYATVTNCYNSGSVTGNSLVGGVCGQNNRTVTNCYYLTGMAAGGINGSDAAGQAEAKTETEFASGEVAWLLQNGQTEQVWGQTIGTDEYPVLGGEKVYQYSDGTYGNTPLQAGEDGFYLISTADELRLFASMVNGGQTSINGKLTADIVLNDTTNWKTWNESTAPTNSWTPIGSSWENQFTGILDGDGHSVSGIYINSGTDYQGLVGVLGEGGTLQDLGVKASYIKGVNQVGGLCGWNFGTVTNCYNTGSVAGNGYVGGLCGLNYGTVTNCYNSGSVTGNDYVGGVCGQNYATVTNCYYLDTCGATEEGTSKTADEFASGEVAWLLQGEQEGQVWGQTIGTEDYPVLGGLKVYNNNGTYSNMAMDGDGFYLISTADELRLFASMVNSGQTSINGRLTADILLNDTTGWENWGNTAPANSWTPIGNNSQPFTGTLDGDGHSVSGIYINSTAAYQGLVGYLDNGGTLQNLGVKASYIKGSYTVGGLCGRKYGTVTNCYNTGNVTGTGDYAGGLCGWNSSGTVTNCYNTGSVSGNRYVGGVCGDNYGGTMTNCYYTGSVTGSYYVGGLCGTNSGTVTNCYYLNTCGAAGVGTSKTADEFASGEVAWLLSTGENGEIWGQNLTFDPKDDYPVLGGKKVYNNNGTYSNMAMDGDGFYLISNADELRLFASMVNSGQTSINGKLTADILLNDTTNWTSWNETTAPANSWTPIGSGSQPFTGTLDGDGHSVSGIYINSEADYQGLVGYLGSGGALQNLGVKASYIKGGNAVGSLCGWNDYGTLTNCYNIGSVESTGAEAGGVCGTSTSGNVSNCYNTGSVTGYKRVGGVCGGNSGTVTNCYNTGSVEGNEIVGGVCGRNSSTVTNCYNSGSVEGNYSVGGVCGLNYGIMTNCYNTGSVEGYSNVGGVCGNSWGNVTNCYYLNTCGAAGVGTSKTSDEFASGEVAWLLQNGQTEQVWGQAIGTDESPVWQTEGNKVYKLTLQNGEEANALYANSGNFTLPAPAEREGYTFAGWFTAQADGTQVQDDATLTTDLTLYAQWTANSYTVTFDANGGEGSMNQQTFTYDVKQTLTPNAFTRTGYSFTGWNTQADGNGSTYVDKAEVQNLTAEAGANITLYAQWSINSYTIRFVNADGTELQSSEVEYGQTPAYNGETPTKESTAEFDYTFAGWTPQIANVTEEATYKATYTATKRSYTLTVALAEGCEEMGEVSGSGSYEYGTVVTLTATAHEGYKFMQWSDGDTNATRTIIVEGEVTLTATFEAEGGSETGLEEQMADTFQVIGMERSMRIEGSEQEACVFNTAGQLIYRGTKRIIEVHAAGIYLVRIGNETKRVMVR